MKKEQQSPVIENDTGGNKDLGEIMMMVQESIKKVDSSSGKSLFEVEERKKEEE
jgi:hypothetical protein